MKNPFKKEPQEPTVYTAGDLTFEIKDGFTQRNVEQFYRALRDLKEARRLGPQDIVEMVITAYKEAKANDTELPPAVITNMIGAVMQENTTREERTQAEYNGDLLRAALKCGLLIIEGIKPDDVSDMHPGIVGEIAKEIEDAHARASEIPGE